MYILHVTTYNYYMHVLHVTTLNYCMCVLYVTTHNYYVCVLHVTTYNYCVQGAHVNEKCSHRFSLDCMTQSNFYLNLYIFSARKGGMFN